MPPSPAEQLARAVDHTQLDPSAGEASIVAVCDEAAAHGFAAVCIYPWWLSRARAELTGDTALCTVVAFPHGLETTAVKCDAAREAIAAGADEIDVVIAVAALCDGDEAGAGNDLAAVVAAARAERGDVVVKAIIESPLLSDAQIAAACRLVAASGADFAKTATGTAGGATVEAVSVMRSLLPPGVAVKASGGIRTAVAARAMLDAGAERLGTSSGVSIMTELGAHAVTR